MTRGGRRGVMKLNILFASNWGPEQPSFDAKLCTFDLEVIEGEETQSRVTQCHFLKWHHFPDSINTSFH